VAQGTEGELWAEFVACLICFGDGVVAMLWALVGSGRSSAAALQSSGDWLLVTREVRAVCFAVYVVGGVTGRHINPIVPSRIVTRHAEDVWIAPCLVLHCEHCNRTDEHHTTGGSYSYLLRLPSGISTTHLKPGASGFVIAPPSEERSV
jgi:hypothetical protein